MHPKKDQPTAKKKCGDLLLYRSHIFIFLLLSINIAVFSCEGQVIENRFTHYTTADGLAEGDEGSIVQDSTGFIWISTENGLARFDGYNFKIYRYSPTDTNSLRENRLVYLYIDSNKRLWVVSFHWLLLYHPDGEWFEHFSFYGANSDLLVRVCSEENGKLIISSHHGLYKFDPKTKNFVDYHPGHVSLDGFDSYLKDENGVEWYSGLFGLAMYNPIDNKFRIFDSSVFPHRKNEKTVCSQLLLLKENNLLISTYNEGLILFNRKTYRYKHYPVNKINPFFPVKGAVVERSDCIYKLNDSIILCSVGGGISTLNWHTDKVSCFLPEKMNPSSLLEKDLRLRSFLKDRDGIIWAGGRSLEKYDYKDFVFNEITGKARPADRDLFDDFEEVFRTSNGEYLLGNHGGKKLYDPVSNRAYNLDEAQFHRTTNFNSDASGNIWCYKANGLLAFRINNNAIANSRFFEIPFTFKSLNDVKLDRNGRALIATSAGVVIFDTASHKFNLLNNSTPQPSQLSISHCLCVCADHTGCSWVGTIRGLNKIEKDGFTVVQYNKNKKIGRQIKDCWINDIKEDSHGILWFATNEHGIGRLDPTKDSLSFISVAQGLPTCKIESLCIDEQGKLWALTFSGNILIVDTKTLNNKICTQEEGFPNPDNVKSIHYSQYSKSVYVLTNNSIIEISGRIQNPNYILPPPIITGFSIFDNEKALGRDKKLTLNYTENFINIKFACLQYHNNGQIKYAYKLDGVDKDWVFCNFRRHAPYTNLEPGTYTFYVKAQSPDGDWNTTPTQFVFTIAPPFWETWWFYLLETAFGVCVLIWIIRLYLQRKLSKQKAEFEKLKAVTDERSRIALDIHDDLGAGLTSIRLLGEIANLKTPNDNLAKNEIEKIIRSAEHLSDNLKEIIWTMNSNFDRLDDFIIYIRNYAVAFFDDTTIAFSFLPTASIPDVLLPGELRRNLLLCIKEALNNIVKHSRASLASLSLEISGNNVIVTIKDNGVGIDFDKLQKFGNGLNTMKKRLEKHQGSMKIKTENGTTLIFTIPIENLP